MVFLLGLGGAEKSMGLNRPAGWRLACFHGLAGYRIGTSEEASGDEGAEERDNGNQYPEAVSRLQRRAATLPRWACQPGRERMSGGDL